MDKLLVFFLVLVSLAFSQALVRCKFRGESLECDTLKILEDAFMREGALFAKYTLFANLARDNGDDNQADLFDSLASERLDLCQTFADDLGWLRETSCNLV